MEKAGKLALYVSAFVLLVSCSTSTYFVWEGGTVVLKCGITDSPENSAWTWCERENKIDCKTVIESQSPMMSPFPPWTSADVTLVEGNTLKITSASYPRDNGTFRCSSDKGEKSWDLFVLVGVKNVTISGPEFPVPENTEVTFTCEAEGGNPAPNITWEIPETSTQLEPTLSDVSSQISLTLTKDMNNKELVCRAQQRDRTLNESILLNITYKPTVQIQITPAEYYHGNEVTLTCSADGYPDPNISWIFDDKPIKDIPPTKNTLHIGGLTQSDTGIYTCLAVNSEGNNTASANLTLTTKKPEEQFFTRYFWALVVFPLVVLVMLGLIAILCYRQSKITNDQDVMASKTFVEEECVARAVIDGEAKTATEGETTKVAVGETHGQELQGHYTSIWFDPEVAGTLGVRRREEPTIYAQIDFKASARLIHKEGKGKGKGKKSKI